MDIRSKDAKWAWTKDQEQAFNPLKDSLTTAPILRMPVISEPFELVADALGVALGAVLLQDGQPIAFETLLMSLAEKNYKVREQELLAVVHALKLWGCVVEGSIALS